MIFSLSLSLSLYLSMCVCVWFFFLISSTVHHFTWHVRYIASNLVYLYFPVVRWHSIWLNWTDHDLLQNLHAGKVICVETLKRWTSDIGIVNGRDSKICTSDIDSVFYERILHCRDPLLGENYVVNGRGKEHEHLREIVECREQGLGAPSWSCVIVAS